MSRNAAADSGSAEINQPKKLNGSSAETPSYQNLHRELLLSHKRLVQHRVHLALCQTETGWPLRVCVRSLTVALAAQGPAAGGETRAEASPGAAQTGAAQGGGDGPTEAFGSGDGAAQEAAEAARGLKFNPELNTQKIMLYWNLGRNT